MPPKPTSLRPKRLGSVPEKTNECVIVDIDGTLADISGRRHFLEGEKKDWDAFFEHSMDDKPIPHVVKLCRMIYASTTRLFIVSGMPEHYKMDRQEWLSKKAKVKFNALFMRKSGDFRPDNVVKKDILQSIKDVGYVPIAAIDDRPSVIRMWEEQGVPVLSVMNSSWPKQGEHYVPYEHAPNS